MGNVPREGRVPVENRQSNGLNRQTRPSTVLWALGTLVAAGWVSPVLAQGPPPGRGPNQPDMRTIHALFAEREVMQIGEPIVLKTLNHLLGQSALD